MGTSLREIELFPSTLGIRKTLTPYNPQLDGMVERSNRTLATQVSFPVCARKQFKWFIRRLRMNRETDTS